MNNPMGAALSKASEPAVEEKLAERLQALEVKETQHESDKDYVYVDGDAKRPTGKYSPTVSISEAEQWEKELLEDPKVNYPSILQF